MKKLLAFILTLVMVASTFTMLPLSVSADTAPPELLTYSQDYAGQPAGSGTEADPYKIATADDLLWMAKQHHVDFTYGGITVPAEGTKKNPFEGKYFIQVANIDLGGKVIPSIGGINGCTMEFTDLHPKGKYAAFGGNYDGNGYAISNGYVVNQNPSFETLMPASVSCYYYGTGLFGVIYGATISNVTLKNLDIYTASNLEISHSGLLVGMAVAPISTAEDNSLINFIYNCYADSDCDMIARYTTAPGSLSSYARHHIWGGLVGAAYRTSISYCENNANISANNNMYAVGGIVGQIFDGNVVNCINNGDITISGGANDVSWKAQRGFGGIVGNIPYNKSSDGTKVAYKNDVNITNCANTGNISNDGVAKKTYAVGGILGTTRKMYGELNITNCYNLGNINTSANDGVAYSEGAIIGGIQFFSSNIDSYPFNVNIDKVYSVKVENLNVSDDFGGGNYVSVSADDGTVMWSSFNMGGSYEDIYDSCFTVGKYSIGERDILAKQADMACAADLYVQSHTNGSYRFLATINSADIEDWDKVGFEVTLVNNDGAKSNVKDVEVTKCYTAITANGKPVADANGRLFIVFVLKGDFSDIKGYEFSAYVTEGDNTYNTRIGTGDFG